MDKMTHYQAMLEEVFQLDEHGFPDEAVKKAEEVAAQAAEAGDEGYEKFFLGESLCLKGKLKNGLKLEAEALDILGDIPFIHVNYGVLLSITGHVKKAIEHLDKALNVEADNIQALAQKGVCLAKLSRFEEALACFDRILEMDPENLHALRNKGVCLSNLYREDEALEHFDRVLTADPADLHARSEKKILKEELEMRRTPFGWLAYKVRKSVLPKLKSAKLRLLD